MSFLAGAFNSPLPPPPSRHPTNLRRPQLFLPALGKAVAMHSIMHASALLAPASSASMPLLRSSSCWGRRARTRPSRCGSASAPPLPACGAWACATCSCPRVGTVETQLYILLLNTTTVESHCLRAGRQKYFFNQSVPAKNIYFQSALSFFLRFVDVFACFRL